MPGAYGAGLQALIDEKGWTAQEDLAKAYVSWSNFAYGGGAEGTADLGGFEQRLAQTEAVIHNQDNQEHDILDSDDYYQFEGAQRRGKNGAGWRSRVGLPQRPFAPENPLHAVYARNGAHRAGRAANPKWIAAPCATDKGRVRNRCDSRLPVRLFSNDRRRGKPALRRALYCLCRR